MKHSPSENVQAWTILLIDDYYDNIMVAQTTLEYHGAEVVVAKDGQQALNLLNEVMPTAILADLRMPVCNGWQFLAAARQYRELDHVPIIAITAHAMNGDRDSALAAGFDDYIAKPYNIHTLIPVLQAAIRRRNES